MLEPFLGCKALCIVMNFLILWSIWVSLLSIIRNVPSILQGGLVLFFFPSSLVLLWTPTYGQAKAGRQARTYIQQLCEDTGCNPEDLPEAMNDREKWREMVRDIRTGGTTWWWWWWFPSKCNFSFLQAFWFLFYLVVLFFRFLVFFSNFHFKHDRFFYGEFLSSLLTV